MASEDCLRIARHARRKGGVFPRFSDDEFLQHCVEEALMEKLEARERREQIEEQRRLSVAAAEERAQEKLRQLREAESRA